MDLSHVNIWAVVVGAITSFALGSLWYSPLLFATTWMKENGFTEEDMKDGNMFQIFGTSLLISTFSSLSLALILPADATLKTGVVYGVICGVGMVMFSIGMNYLYERKSVKLWLITGGYQAVCFVIFGAILGFWK